MFRTARLPRGVLVGGALALALAVSGCAAGQISQTADQVAAIDGANATVGDVGVRNALLATAPATGYAKGADAPLLLTISNDGVDGDTLSQVSSAAAADVQISGTAALPGQALTTFGTDTPAKVTLKGLTAPLVYGQSVPVTFSFAKAGSVTVNVPIEIPAERSGERPTVDIQPAEPTPLWLSGESAGG